MDLFLCNDEVVIDKLRLGPPWLAISTLECNVEEIKRLEYRQRLRKFDLDFEQGKSCGIVTNLANEKDYTKQKDKLVKLTMKKLRLVPS